MPPRVGRKSISPWNLCENCKVIVSQKDLAIHIESSCPPSATSWDHGYVKDGVLYGVLEEIKSQDGIKNLPKLECDNLVLLSQSALQLCDIGIGDAVEVHLNGISTVKTAWPTLERNLVSVLMTKKAIMLHWSGDFSCHITVKKLREQPLPAKEVFVDVKKQLSGPIPDLSVLLQGKYRSKVLKSGDKLSLQHYGKDLHFTITKIIPFGGTPKREDVSNSDKLIKELQQLSLNAVSSNEEISENYFKMVEDTRWLLDIAEFMNEETNGQIRHVHMLASIGGMQRTIEEMGEIIQLALKNASLAPGLPVVRGVLLYGVAGTGKTMLAEALASESGAFIVRVCGAEVYSKFLGETEAKLRELFTNAEQMAPSIILIDEIDALCPKRGSDGSGGSDQDKRVVATLLTLLDRLHLSSVSPHKAVLVIGTTSKPDAIDPALRRPGRLDREIEICVPSPDARVDILHKILKGIQHKLSEEELKSIAYSAHGFVGADLASLCSRASMQAMKKNCSNDMNTITVTVDDLAWALSQVKPSAMREVLIEVPNVRWSDIGGQHDLKLKLRQAVEWPLKHPEAFVRLGISPPRGVLMYGPPGCSKTMIAKALATESKLNFLSIKGPELFSKWVGESERAVREVFRKARQVAPAIVFFDELDALGGERSTGGGSTGSNVQERVLAQLLTELDGVEPLGNVTVVGATNRPDRIDKALLRPGRLDRVVYVPLPDADTRQEIFELQLSRMPVGVDVDISELVSNTESYSGAEVLAVCHEAALKALEDDLNAENVCHCHFTRALQLVTPRTPKTLLQLYEKYDQN